MNALDTAMQEEIRTAAAEATERDDVRAVVIWGGDKVFAAGADITEMADLSYTDMVKRSGTQRREHFVVLLSHKYPSNDAMSAFVQSVDQIINISDLANFKPVLRRGVAQHRELYHAFHETAKAVQAI